jgi:hypothetical protein
MAKLLRFQNPGGIYHVMARGDGGKTVFQNRDDCRVSCKKESEIRETIE